VVACYRECTYHWRSESLDDDGGVVWWECQRGPVVVVRHTIVCFGAVVVGDGVPCEEQVVVVCWIARSGSCGIDDDSQHCCCRRRQHCSCLTCASMTYVCRVVEINEPMLNTVPVGSRIPRSLQVDVHV
jgi:hypothetical protein